MMQESARAKPSSAYAAMFIHVHTFLIATLQDFPSLEERIGSNTADADGIPRSGHGRTWQQLVRWYRSDVLQAEHHNGSVEPR